MRRHSVSQLILVAACAVFALGLAKAQSQSGSSTAGNSPATQSNKKSNSPSHDMSGMPGMDGMQGMPGMQHDAEAGANSQMSHEHHGMGPHMHMTALRPSNPEDWARADKITDTLRESIERYKDYKVALADGYQPFLPNLPQDMYHFTNYANGFLEAFTFDPARPTSLLYKKTSTGWLLIGAMYTMPRSATEEQLNERVPLSIAQWHLHTNLCVPPRGAKNVDWKEFGLTGSISSKPACTAAGGKFLPAIFGWMVHVYPYENSKEKVWEQ